MTLAQQPVSKPTQQPVIKPSQQPQSQLRTNTCQHWSVELLFGLRNPPVSQPAEQPVSKPGQQPQPQPRTSACQHWFVELLCTQKVNTTMKKLHRKQQQKEMKSQIWKCLHRKLQ